MSAIEPTTMQKKKARSNVTIAAFCLAFFGGMIGLAYASVPLYKLFCQVTGYGGTTQRAELAPNVVLDKTINVRFDANTNGINWDFKPRDRVVTLKIGETKQIEYLSTNKGKTASTGTATFNVTPQWAGSYFNKVACFCFTETTLQPGETLEMPVVFFIDPEIVNAPEMKNIHTITLSYTFFPVDEPTQPAVSQLPKEKDGSTLTNGDGNGRAANRG